MGQKAAFGINLALHPGIYLSGVAMLVEQSDPLIEEALNIHFQPIVSLRQKAVVGLEALVRPRPRPGATPLAVPDLFRLAHDRGEELEFDRLLRRMAMDTYRGMSLPQAPRPLLFVNFEASLLDLGVGGSGYIQRAAQEAGLQPEDVVIEINESQVIDIGALRNFVDFYRERGFLIALDDLGAGHSNLPRVAALKPEILKVDRALIQGIDRDFYKQETFKSLVSLGARTGCLVLAEGTETEAEVECCATLGAALFQGYFFARPQAPEDIRFEALLDFLALAGQRLRASAVRSIQSRRRTAGGLRRLSESVRDLLMHADPTGYDLVLERMVQAETQIECAYVLNRDGVQVTLTHSGAAESGTRGRLFAPAPRGADHSAKEYFFSLLDAGLERYTTDVYLSMATGKPCRTVACQIPRRDGERLVLCLDFRMEA